MVIWLGTALFGDNEFGVRVVGVLMIALDQVLIYAITRTLTGNERTAAWALVLANVTTLAAMSIFMVPDQPMIFFYLISFYAMARIARGAPSWWWLIVGAGGGLAALSKLTTLLLAVAVPIWLFASPPMRRWLGTPWPYLGLAVALAIFSPNVIWNIRHDWVTFDYHLTRRTLEGIDLGGLAAYLVQWPIMATPLVLVMSVAGFLIVMRRGWIGDPTRALLVITPMPFALYMIYHSFKELVSPNWFAPLVWLAVVFAAISTDISARGAAGRIIAFCRRFATPLGLLIAAGFYFALLERFLPLPVNSDVTSRFRGWDEFANNQEERRAEAGAEYIIGPDYYGPAMIRFYVGDSSLAYQLGDYERWAQSSSFGIADRVLADAVGLYVGSRGEAYEESRVREYFNTVERVEDVLRPLRPTGAIRHPAWLVSDPKPTALPLFGANVSPGG